MSIDLDLADVTPDIPVALNLKAQVQSLAKRFFGTRQRTMGSLCLLAVCFGVIGWNLSRLAILDELVHLEIREFQLDSELIDLEFELAAIDLERLTAEIDAENDQIFQGLPQLAAWADSLRQRAANHALALQYRISEAHPSPVPDVLEFPVQLSLSTTAEFQGNSFASATGIVHELLLDRWHIEVLSTTAKGNGEGLQALDLTIQVWVKDRYGFIASAEG